MVTLYFINFIANTINSLVLALFGWAMPVLSDLTSFISNISLPQTFYNIFALVVAFLPTGTITILGGLTFVLVLIKLIGAVCHVLSLGLLFGN